MDAFASAQRGTVLLHHHLADVIGEDFKSMRYRTVIGAWKRKMLNEFGRSVTAMHGQGYRIDDVGQQIDAGGRTWKRGVRDMVKAVRTVEVLPASELQPHQKRARDHYMTSGVELLEQARAHSKSGLRMLGAAKD